MQRPPQTFGRVSNHGDAGQPSLNHERVPILGRHLSMPWRRHCTYSTVVDPGVAPDWSGVKLETDY